ncbi:MAG: hypothetical protein U9O94_07555 [Nanoarchaeota archaeon]|nr:hypothetical protein [Nanoarchaeota archaeon]
MRLRFILLVLMISLFSSSAYAISIGASPGRVTFNDLLREGYAERTVKITTNSADEITAHYEVEGEVGNWLSFEPEGPVFILSSGNPHTLKIIINPPNDVQSGVYSGKVHLITDRFGSPSGRAGGVVRAAITLLLDAIVIDTETIACRAGAFDIKDIEVGYPIEVTYTVTNDGNVRIRPLVRVDIWDQMQDKLILSEQFTSPEVLPTTQRRISKILESKDLEVGQYWVTISIDECLASSLLSFNVFEKGGIVDKGILESITNDGTAYVGDPIEVVAVFRNIGTRIVSARFKGSVKLKGKIVQVIESEEVDVGSGEAIDLRAYFTPNKPGKYEITGRVLFNRKLTFEKGSLISIDSRPIEERSRFVLLLLYLILLITILFLLRKIMKAKKRREKKHHH